MPDTAQAPDPTLESYQKLFDPAEYGVIPSVPVYKEHVRKLANGHELKITKKELERIAALKNAKEKTTLSLAPLGPGHTKDDAPEEAQPPVWGYQRNWRVVYDRRQGKWVLLTDWYIKRRIHRADGKIVDGVAYAKTFPRRSVEIWPDDLDIDWTALLRVTPELDMGQIDYSAGPGVVRYQRSRSGKKFRYHEESSMADDTQDPTVPPTDAVPATDEPLDEDHAEAAEKYAKHVFGMPHHHVRKLMHHLHRIRYGKDYPEGADDDGDADDAPAIDEQPQEPVQYAAGPGVGSATDAFTPELVGKEKERMQKAQADIQKSRYQRELDEMKQQLATERNARLAMEKRERIARYERDLSQLLAEGYSFDLAEEVAEVSDFDQAKFDKHKSRIKTRYQKAPVAMPGVPGLDSAPTNGRQPTQQQMKDAVRLATRKNVDFDDALKEIMGS